MKLFIKSFERRRLFEKRRHPKTFVIFYLQVIFTQSRHMRAPFSKVALSKISFPDFRNENLRRASQ
ncbi:hypothetical protein C3920_06325 [Novacetimonas pomaceti]|uniref:Uncharacterized protein n=1 Tax=Novacetimonas pomaceti TaxID=2021998 RepID=A0ABX5P2Y4_9PROT|nr:hypothetical protein C3920_06325 [Novacetimonas pomaceti]